ARPATDQCDRPAAMALQVDEPEDRDEVADVEPRPGRIEADVAADRPAVRETRLEAVRRGMEHASPAELGQQAVEASNEGGHGKGVTRAAMRSSSRQPMGEWVLHGRMVSSPPHADRPPEALAAPPERSRSPRTWRWRRAPRRSRNPRPALLQLPRAGERRV